MAHDRKEIRLDILTVSSDLNYYEICSFKVKGSEMHLLQCVSHWELRRGNTRQGQEVTGLHSLYPVPFAVVSHTTASFLGIIEMGR